MLLLVGTLIVIFFATILLVAGDEDFFIEEAALIEYERPVRAIGRPARLRAALGVAIDKLGNSRNGWPPKYKYPARWASTPQPKLENLESTPEAPTEAQQTSFKTTIRSATARQKFKLRS